jgi:hypothetical protein
MMVTATAPELPAAIASLFLTAMMSRTRAAANPMIASAIATRSFAEAFLRQLLVLFLLFNLPALILNAPFLRTVKEVLGMGRFFALFSFFAFLLLDLGQLRFFFEEEVPFEKNVFDISFDTGAKHFS